MKQFVMPVLLLGTILVSCKKEHDKIQQTYNLEKIKSDLSLINEQKNSEEAIRLTIQYERYVNSLEGVSPLEKQTLFSGFAVAKYSSKFWNQIISE